MRETFPYPILFIIGLWLVLSFAYLICRWRQRPKATYVIPRVFVLCSPRTVQFHYELILRVGMPSPDYNPDKHDIDITVQGQQRNEVVPMTRLNTKTLLDEPLITSLSIVVYRLVELPTLGSLVLKHSGPYKAWVYVYDFTVIDLSNSREHYYTINKYIGSLNRVITLEESNDSASVRYPIDDVPLPSWSLEDIFLVIFVVINCIMLSMTMLPLSCGNELRSDIVSIALASFNGGAVVLFFEWLLYYYARWNSERREYFNLPENGCCSCNMENCVRLSTMAIAIFVGGLAIYFGFRITNWHDSIVWFLATTNTCILVIGFWNAIRQTELCESISATGLKLRGIDNIPIGMKHSEIVANSENLTKSGSASDDGHSSGLSSATSKFVPVTSFGPRSSIKSFGFDPVTGHASRRNLSKTSLSRTGVPSATNIPEQQPVSFHAYINPVLL